MQFYGVLLGIGAHIPESKYRKLACCLWLLPAYIIQQYYLASLVNTMAFTRPIGDINTLQQLIDSKMNIACTPEMRAHFCRSVRFVFLPCFSLL